MSIVTGGKPKFDLQKCDLSPKNLMCGTIIASENVGGLPVKEFGITSGNFEKVVDATGETTLIFFIKPSGYSSNGDHGYTRFFIRNLKIINLY